MNINLAHVLEQCRSKNMPKASIEAAIKSAVGQRCSHHRAVRTVHRKHIIPELQYILSSGEATFPEHV